MYQPETVKEAWRLDALRACMDSQDINLNLLDSRGGDLLSLKDIILMKEIKRPKHESYIMLSDTLDTEHGATTSKDQTLILKRTKLIFNEK